MRYGFLVGYAALTTLYMHSLTGGRSVDNSHGIINYTTK